MRTIRIKLYKFDELSKDAQQTAIENYRNHSIDAQFITDEANETLDKFCDIFQINYREFDYCEFYRSSYSFKLNDKVMELSGQRLANHIWNNYRFDIFKGKYYGRLVNTNKDGSPITVSKLHPAGMRHVKRYSKCQLDNDCVLTGVCYDMDVLQPIYDFLNKPSKYDFADLLEECLSSLAASVCKEIEYQYSNEAIIDSIQANEYEFTKDGKIS